MEKKMIFKYIKNFFTFYHFAERQFIAQSEINVVQAEYNKNFQKQVDLNSDKILELNDLLIKLLKEKEKKND
tara:strand:+ start:219 stop:434 length:216 start_codon:yes stop_codon:yes gene_type:complete